MPTSSPPSPERSVMTITAAAPVPPGPSTTTLGLDGISDGTTRTCQRPVRLTGRIDAIDLSTGELRPVYDTATQPGGVHLAPCGNRRETICSACSQTYKRDARQLVQAGLLGGKGLPESV